MKSLPLHNLMLRDQVRMDAYARAIRKVVRTGDVVLDLGAGTGILGFLALRAGARRVHAVEKSSVIHAARAVARDLGCEHQIEWHQRPSREVELLEPADVIVTETFGHFAVEEDALASIADARSRLAAPGSRVIPGKVHLMVRAASAPGAFAGGVAWRRPVQGVSLSAIAALAIHLPQALPKWPRRFLSKPYRLHSFDLCAADSAPLPVDTACDLRIETAGSFHGAVGYFRASLAPRITLDSSAGTHWLPVLFPAARAVAVRPGDRVHLELRIEPDSQYSWSYRVSRRRTVLARSEHSTLLIHPSALEP